MPCLLRAVILVGLTSLLCGCVRSQHWHFSNGWVAGKRSPLNDCQFRPQVKALISRIIDDELTRLQRVCSRTPFPIQDTRSYLQTKSAESYEADQS